MRLSSVLLLLIAFTFIISGCRTAKLSADGPVLETFSPDAAWCWFSDPRAIYHAGEHQRTYASWVDSSGNVLIGYYDHQSGDTETHVLHEKLEVDDHDNPALHMMDDGRLMVLYSRHSRSTPIYQMVSQNAEDISNWEERRSLYLNDTVRYADYSNTYTYVNLWEVEDQLFLLWRGADFKPNFSISDDKGQSWSKGQILILPERIYRNRRPYLKAFSDGRRLHLAFTDGHPRNETENSIYYTYYEKGNFYRADGSLVSSLADVPFKPEAADMVHNGATENKAWIWDLTADAQGNPVLTYASFPEDSIHDYHYARWNGQQWEKEWLVRAGSWFPEDQPGIEQREPNYSGGIVVDHETPETIYMSVQKNGIFEIEQWTRQANNSWDKQAITTNSSRNNIRPYAVLGADDSSPLQLLFLTNEHYLHYTDYRSALRMWFTPNP
jgi:hypothetical protein